MEDQVRYYIWFAWAIVITMSFWIFSCGLILEAQEKEQATPAYVVSVVDGDTAWLGIVTKVRISNIDTPETYRPRCPEEKELGLQATAMVRQLMPKGSLVFLKGLKYGADYYKRTLARVVTSDGRDIGEVLITHNLAKPWKGKRHKWCEELQQKKEEGKEEKAHATAD